MLEQETIKKSLYNIYGLIYSYKSALKQKIEQEETDYSNIKSHYNYTEKSKLDFEISIYNNIEKKYYPFTQIFDLENETPYILDSLETEILRNYIGLYTNGETEPTKELSKTFNCSKTKIIEYIGNSIESFMDLNVQEQILSERNKLIRENITNQKLKEKILNRSIEFLTITTNLLEILKMNKIYTIKDLTAMDYKKLEKINYENGYESDIIIFPRSIIEEIHDLGLHFEKLEDTFKEIYEDDKKLTEEFLEKTNIKSHTNKIKTILDMISIQQFEPEIIKTLELNKRITVDTIINNGYKKNKYKDMVEEIQREMLKKLRKRELYPKEVIKKEFPYMIDEEIEIIEKELNEMYEINNKIEEPTYKLKRTYYTNKN